jgi:hypothetical protein
MVSKQKKREIQGWKKQVEDWNLGPTIKDYYRRLLTDAGVEGYSKLSDGKTYEPRS